ncbi:MAG TPA: energy transducer TonB [Cyclobacteriaceae bacterium]|jgi:TonB family protein|nr:energy transducer TonB [Cyclobacteriaceae bacterium]
MTNLALAQEALIQTDFEKGYIKDGQRISVWQYFDLARKPELIINYASGKVMFLSKDTSDYFILKNSQWVASKLDVHPVPITGSVNFYNDVKNKIIYPQKDFEAGLEGKVIVLFEVDTLGNSINYSMGKSIGGACDSAVVRCLRSIDQKWIPAVSKGKKYHAQFAVDVEFRLNERVAPLEHEEYELKKAKLLTSIIVAKDEKVFNFVEKSAEFVGGIEALYKYISKNLQYPPSARRLGIESTVTTKFIIEPDGKITNGEILRGFQTDCNNEALRLIQSMPRWKPGTQGGRPVRQAYVLPVRFRLSDILLNR